jgi:hypothetical protein
MGILLALLAFIGVVTLGTWGYILTVLFYLVTFKFKKLFDYHENIAISLDKLGNVLLGLLMNLFLIKKDSLEKYGDHMETISDNTGDNKKLGELKPIGKVIADGLNKIDPNHVEKASKNKI